MRADWPVAFGVPVPRKLPRFRVHCNAPPNGTAEWSHTSTSAGTDAILDKKRNHARMGIKRWFDLAGLCQIESLLFMELALNTLVSVAQQCHSFRCHPRR